jgi:uncharacterized membrane protein
VLVGAPSCVERGRARAFPALGSSVVWGAADFAGGSLSRRLPVLGVTIVSQAAGFLALLVAVAVRGDVGARSLALGLAAGVGGGIGLAAFYRALSLGTMSVISPIVACGALVPFGLSLATGERPAFALAGAVAALAGAVLASLEERRAASESPGRARAVVLAVAAAFALGLFVYFLGLGSREGDPLSTLFGARIGSLAVLVVVAVLLRAPVRIRALDRRGRSGWPRRRLGERGLRGGQRPRAAGARLGARVLVSGRHRPARARPARGAPDADAEARSRTRAGGRRGDRRRIGQLTIDPWSC